MPKIMSIDIETYSSVDLNECGVYKYVESEDFDILLFAYAYDNSNNVAVLLPRRALWLRNPSNYEPFRGDKIIPTLSWWFIFR